ncbi:unnamed protein product [Nezara viridula]|uniref:Uncharacterized protein n=1 Tax=Nezara viridula TaxID=85310 RepID=A0A9P0HMP4_NEZVI|nr:unnamed protein product [Nezara viridula]
MLRTQRVTSPVRYKYISPTAANQDFDGYNRLRPQPRPRVMKTSRSRCLSTIGDVFLLGLTPGLSFGSVQVRRCRVVIDPCRHSGTPKQWRWLERQSNVHPKWCKSMTPW